METLVGVILFMILGFGVIGGSVGALVSIFLGQGTPTSKKRAIGFGFIAIICAGIMVAIMSH